MLGLTVVQQQCWSLCNAVEQEGLVVVDSQDGLQLASKQHQVPKIGLPYFEILFSAKEV